MICCDKCDQWYHGVCVEVFGEAKDIVKYYCPTCCETHGLKTVFKRRNLPPVLAQKVRSQAAVKPQVVKPPSHFQKPPSHFQKPPSQFQQQAVKPPGRQSAPKSAKNYGRTADQKPKPNMPKPNMPKPNVPNIPNIPKPNVVKKDPNAPKKAMTAYTFYMVERRPQLKAQFPDWPFGEFGKTIGAD